MAFIGDNVAVSPATVNALAASAVVKATPGVLYGFWALNTNGSTRYIQFYNTTSVPADTAVPYISIPLATATQSGYIDLGVYGIQFNTGICWANSSTIGTKTIGSADSLVLVNFA